MRDAVTFDSGAYSHLETILVGWNEGDEHPHITIFPPSNHLFGLTTGRNYQKRTMKVIHVAQVVHLPMARRRVEKGRRIYGEGHEWRIHA